MQSVDYDEISKMYDQVREGDLSLVRCLVRKIPSRSGTRVLDIGCGTGNYTNLVQKLTRAEIYGVDPSEGMLQKACQKNQYVTFRLGQADTLPFEKDFFDFIYMTDVIHHVPDINRMLAEIWRVLHQGGNGCIVSQSHQQIEARPITDYFPTTAAVDKARYPDIEAIVQAAVTQGFIEIQRETLKEESVELDDDFLELVRKKGYSMLHLIPEDDYQSGLKALEQDLQNGPISAKPAGFTLVWFSKP